MLKIGKYENRHLFGLVGDQLTVSMQGSNPSWFTNLVISLISGFFTLKIGEDMKIATFYFMLSLGAN